jgi:teichuronic acid biosynthesis glycosyltransferase TuaG
MQNFNPLISVVIPTYNHAKFLKEALDSVLAQTYTNYEIIIVNNFSEDNTIEVAESYKNPLIHLYNFRNNGVIAASRNYGIKQAKGEYIAFLDSDDVWKPNKLEEQIKYFNENSDLLLVSSNGIYFPKMFKKQVLYIHNNISPTFRELLSRNYVGNSSVLMKKCVVDMIGYLDEKIELRAIEDYDFWLRVLKGKDKSILVLKNLLVKYRKHGSNISNLNTADSVIKYYQKFIVLYNKYLNDDPEYVKNIISAFNRKIDAYRIRSDYFEKRINVFKLIAKKELNLYEKLVIIAKKMVGNFINFKKRLS